MANGKPGRDPAYTGRQYARVRQLVEEQGNSLTDTARMVGLSRNTVVRIRRKQREESAATPIPGGGASEDSPHGLTGSPPPGQPQPTGEATASKCPAAPGKHHLSVEPRLPPPLWTPERDRELARLWNELSTPDLLAHLQRMRGANIRYEHLVSVRAKELGLGRKKPIRGATAGAPRVPGHAKRAKAAAAQAVVKVALPPPRLPVPPDAGWRQRIQTDAGPGQNPYRDIASKKIRFHHALKKSVQTEAELRAAIEHHLATKGVTLCPDAFAESVHNGDGLLISNPPTSAASATSPAKPGNTPTAPTPSGGS